MVTEAVKLGMMLAGTAVQAGITIHGQMQQAKAAKNIASYNAQLNRMDQEQNARNMKIEKNEARKRFRFSQATAANERMSMDFMFADVEAFEYQMLLKDYSLAQANQSLEARARGGIYQGNVKAAQYKAEALGTAMDAAGSMYGHNVDETGKQTQGSQDLLGNWSN